MKWIAVARIGKPRGAKGDLWLEPYGPGEIPLRAGETVGVGKESALFSRYEVKECFEYVKGVVLKLEGVENPQAAGKLKGLELFMSEGRVPESSPDIFDTEGVRGFQVMDVKRGRIGAVEGVRQGRAYWVFLVDTPAGVVEVPAVKGLGVRVDTENEVVETDLPDGYPVVDGEMNAD